MADPGSDVIVIFGSLLSFFLLAILILGGWNSHSASRRAEREAAFKKDMLDRGLSVEEIERLFRATAEPPKQSTKIAEEDVDVVGEFAGFLGNSEPDVIEEILALVRAADSATRRAMLRAVTEMRDSSEEGTLTDEQLRAVVRALARPASPSRQVSAPENDSPFPAAPSRISDAFHRRD